MRPPPINPQVIDLVAHDPATDETVLAIRTDARWDGGPRLLFLLQEKLNTYVSFALDGELAETYPDLASKALRIQLDSAHPLDPATRRMMDAVQQQLALQNIRLAIREPAP